MLLYLVEGSTQYKQEFNFIWGITAKSQTGMQGIITQFNNMIVDLLVYCKCINMQKHYEQEQQQHQW